MISFYSTAWSERISTILILQDDDNIDPEEYEISGFTGTVKEIIVYGY